MLTGVKPYQSDSVLDVIMQHKRAPIPLLPSGLDQFQPLINLMLAKNRKDRFRDADSLLHHVRHMMQSGIIKTSAQAKLRPDVDVSGEHTLPLDKARAIELPVRTSARRSVHVLGGLLAVACRLRGSFLRPGSHRPRYGSAPRSRATEPRGRCRSEASGRHKRRESRSNER